MLCNLDLIDSIVGSAGTFRDEKEPQCAPTHAGQLLAEVTLETRRSFKMPRLPVPSVQLPRFLTELAHTRDFAEAPVDLEFLLRFEWNGALAILARPCRPAFLTDPWHLGSVKQELHTLGWRSIGDNSQS
jgi:hypothetical protein